MTNPSTNPSGNPPEDQPSHDQPSHNNPPHETNADAAQRKAEANRQNARKSTGPKTPEGKARSAQNATKHGLTSLSLTPLLQDENPTAFETFQSEMLADLAPRPGAERLLAHRLIAVAWRLERIPRMERDTLDQNTSPAELSYNSDNTRNLALPFARHLAKFQTLTRYESSLARDLHRCLKELQHLQATPASSPKNVISRSEATWQSPQPETPEPEPPSPLETQHDETNPNPPEPETFAPPPEIKNNETNPTLTESQSQEEENLQQPPVTNTALPTETEIPPQPEAPTPPENDPKPKKYETNPNPDTPIARFRPHPPQLPRWEPSVKPIEYPGWWDPKPTDPTPTTDPDQTS